MTKDRGARRQPGIVRCAGWLNANRWVIARVLPAVALTVLQLLLNTHWWVKLVAVLVGAFWVWSEIGSSNADGVDDALAEAAQARAERDRANRDAKDAKERHDEAVAKLTSIHLRGVAHRHGLGNCERVTVYYFRDGRLFFLGRYSRNPELKERGRVEFSTTEGYLGRAWTSAAGTVRESRLPDPAAEQEMYERTHLDAGLQPESFSDLTMRSRCYIGQVLPGPDGENVGVIMFESTEPEGLEGLDSVDESDLMSLGALTVLVRPSISVGQNAREEAGL